MSVRELFTQNQYELYCNTLTLSGDLQLDDVIVNSTVDSTSTSTGALSIKGGVGVAKNLYIGGNENLVGTIGVTGITSLNNTTDSSTTNNGSLVVAGGVGVAKNLNVGGVISGNITTTTFDTTLSGVWAAPLTSKTVAVSKIGNIVTLQYPEGLTGTVTSPAYTWSFPTSIPSGFFNTNHAVNCPIEIVNDNANIMASVRISVDGTWAVYSPASLTGTAGTSTGGFSITYLI